MTLSLLEQWAVFPDGTQSVLRRALNSFIVILQLRLVIPSIFNTDRDRRWDLQALPSPSFGPDGKVAVPQVFGSLLMGIGYNFFRSGF